MNPASTGRLVLDAQRVGEVRPDVAEGVVMRVLRRHGDDAGRRRRHEGVDEGARMERERLLERPDLGRVGAGVDVANRADGHGRLVVAHRSPAGQSLASGLRELRVVRQLAADGALPAAPKSRHAALHIKKKSLAHLLAVARDVDASGALQLDHPARGRLALGRQLSSSTVSPLARRRRGRRGSRVAADCRMGGHNALGRGHGAAY